MEAAGVAADAAVLPARAAGAAAGVLAELGVDFIWAGFVGPLTAGSLAFTMGTASKDCQKRKKLAIRITFLPSSMSSQDSQLSGATKKKKKQEKLDNK